MSRVWLWIAVCGACGDERRPVPAAEPLDQYRYLIEELDPAIPPGGTAIDVTIAVDGKPVGTYGKSFTLPRGTTLTAGGAKLEFVVSTTCGDLRVPLRASFELSEKEQRSIADGLGAKAGSERQIKFRAHREGDWHSYRTIYVDNRVTKPVAIRIGQQELDVEVGKLDGTIVNLGRCEDASRVTLDGKAIGELFPSDVTLLDVAGGHCYVRELAVYTKDGTGGPSPEREYYRTGRGAHLTNVKAAKFGEKAPDSIAVRGTAQDEGDVMSMRTALNPIDCADAR